MTEGAIRAHEQGIVTACSVVANGAAFEHAAERLRDVRSLAVGVHLTLVGERPLSRAVPSLVAGNGLFHESYRAFFPRYLARRIDIGEVEHELRMQVERLLGAGLRPTHVNGHQHLHLLPRIFDLVQQLAEEYDIDYVRIVDEEAATMSVRGASIAMLSRLGRRARHQSRVRTNDRTIGVEAAGQVRSAGDLISLLPFVEGTTELVAHPGIGRQELGASYDWAYAWEEETAALCDPALKAAIAERGIVLGTP